MHRRQRRRRVRGLMGRAWDWLIKRLADSERHRHIQFCAAIERELAARERWYGYA
jgi:hypothetical protein